MKKFSKIVKESKIEVWNKHPLINPIDWKEIFYPLIEHIESNLKSKVSPPGEGIFSSKTKGALNNLIDSITDDYVEYYKNIIDDGSQDSFFNAYDIEVNWEELMTCLQTLMDRTKDVEDYPNWEGGFWYMNLTNLKFDNVNELIEEMLDIHAKLGMFKANHKITINSKANKNSFHIFNFSTDENISKGIKNILELPTKQETEWISGLRSIDIYLYNKDTVQVVDLN